MTEIAIRVHDLSKKYRLFNSARDRLKEALHPFSKRYHRDFWALRQINLAIPNGQTVGILGRNGSGKSTLLQLIAGVMQPTEGSIQTAGRIAALLELGAGFNPEFTGRENVVFNLQMNGLSGREIDRRLPEIQAFADIGDFFEQPVKIYSSGMYVRLAFSVATSVDPNILIIDEALAVGDAQFQEKCYSRLREFRDQGKTILLVSHNVDAVAALCDRAVIVENHRIHSDGEPKSVIDEYLRLMFARSTASSSGRNDTDKERRAAEFCSTDPSQGSRDQCPSCPYYNPSEIRGGNGGASIISYYFSREHTSTHVFMTSEDVELYVKVFFERTVAAPIIGFSIKNALGVVVFGTNTFMGKSGLPEVKASETVVYKLGFSMLMNQGEYFLDLGVAEVDGSPGGTLLDVRRSIIHFRVARRNDAGFGGLVDLGATISIAASPLLSDR